MGKNIDLTGLRFGRLTVVEEAGRARDRSKLWSCVCDCGGTATTTTVRLRNGHTRSCGCYARDRTSETNKTHGHARGEGTRTYNIWATMRQRCNNPNNHAYKDYGGRGITICARWDSFENFLADMGHPPPGLTLDRVFNDKGYSPGNCVWATRKEQANNRRPAKVRRKPIAA